MTDGYLAVGFLAIVDFFRDRLLRATVGWRRNDVIGVIPVTSQAAGVDGDLDIGVRRTAGGMTDSDAFVRSNHLLLHFRSDLFGAPARRCGNDVVLMVAVPVEAVHVDGDLHEGVRRAARGVTDGDSPVVLRQHFRGFFDRWSGAAPGRCGNDVSCVIGVARETVSVYRDLDEWVRLAARGVTDGDLLFGFDLLGHGLGFFGRVFHCASVTPADRGRDDVVTVVAVSVEAVEINGDVNVGIRRALRCVTDSDALAGRQRRS